MKTATQPLIDFLNVTQQFVIADLYTFSVKRVRWGGEVGMTFSYHNYYYTTWDLNLIYEGRTYSATGPLLERNRVRSVVGVEVDSLNIKAYASDSMLIEGIPILQAALKGTLDGALVRLDRAFLNGAEIVGVINMFSGRVANIKASRSVAEIDVASDLELLNANMPRNLYQPGCQHTLYDAGCRADRNSNAAFGTCASGSTTTVINAATSLDGRPAGYFDLGGIYFNSGNNQHILRTVKSWDGTHIELVEPLPFAPQFDDSFWIYPGCDKTQTTCDNKFANLDNFRGFPFVPQPETMR